MIQIIDNFLPDPLGTRKHALESSFVDWSAPDGEVYKRVCITDVPGVRESIERIMGPVDFHGMGYRLNYDGELPNAAIHSDLGWGTHALVLYLCEGYGGTAFWRHRESGSLRIRHGDHALLGLVESGWDDPAQWEMHALAGLQFNRGLIYESALFHSRWPFAAFGNAPENGRLIAIAFFTPKEGACQ